MTSEGHPAAKRDETAPAVPLRLLAWGDESVRTARVEEPAYILGAVVAEPEACEDYREQMRKLQTTKRKLHWHELNAKHRDQVVDVIAGFDVFHVVVVGTTVENRKQERARALCLERLAWELDGHDVSQLILEQRPQSLMAKDRKTIDSLRGRSGLPHGLRVEHGRPLEDPMLWIADQVVGAVGESLAGQTSWYESLSSAIDIVRIEV